MNAGRDAGDPGSAAIAPHAADSAAEAGLPLTIAADHPAFAGHFPGSPLLPGVVLLDEALQAARRAGALPAAPFRIASAKFLRPVTPGSRLVIHHRRAAGGAIEFDIVCAGERVATGRFAPMGDEQTPGAAP
jgi:3-hydroxymyristoyl/3-hydroxydecanoyl-(acyl carrier protein) dehydratase